MSRAEHEPDFDPEGAPREANTVTVPLAALTRQRARVARPLKHWYVAATSEALRAGPYASTVLGVPMVLFRDAHGQAAALLDRCPHRNVPLSDGQVLKGELQCPYHGWRFDGAGRCTNIPCRVEGPGEAKAREATAFPVREQDGLVWVVPSPGVTPMLEPYRFRLLNEPGYATVSQVVEAEASLYAATENALDVPHTAYLHRGLFRGEGRGIAITAKVRREGYSVACEYIGEPRPPGVVGQLLSPSGGTVTHFDRFHAPCVSEVEYRIGDENHLVVATAMTPVDDWHTRLYAKVSFRLRVPHALVSALLKPLALMIFKQDARVLKRQTDAVARFGGEQFASTELDVMGKHIWRLLRAAEREEPLHDHVVEETVTLMV